MGETWLRARIEADFVGRRRSVRQVAGAQMQREFEIELHRARLTEARQVDAPPPFVEGPPGLDVPAGEAGEQSPFRQRYLPEAFIDTGRRDERGPVWLRCAVENLEVRGWTLVDALEEGERSRGTLRGEVFARIVEAPEPAPAAHTVPVVPKAAVVDAAGASVAPAAPSVAEAPRPAVARPLEPLPPTPISGSMEQRMGCAPWLIGLASLFALACALPATIGLVRLQPWWWIVAGACALGALLFHRRGRWHRFGLGVAFVPLAGLAVIVALGWMGISAAAIVAAGFFGGLAGLPWLFILAVVALLATAGLGLLAGRAWGGRIASLGGLGLLLLAAIVFVLRVPSWRGSPLFGPSVRRTAEAASLPGRLPVAPSGVRAVAPPMRGSGTAHCTVGRIEAVGTAASIDRIAAWVVDVNTLRVALDTDLQARRTAIHQGARIQWVRTPSDAIEPPRCEPEACILARPGRTCSACDPDTGATVDLVVARGADGHAEVLGARVPGALVAHSEIALPAPMLDAPVALAPRLVTLSHHRRVLASLVDGVPQLAWDDDEAWSHEGESVGGEPRFAAWSVAVGRRPGSILYAALAPTPARDAASLWVGARRASSVDGSGRYEVTGSPLPDRAPLVTRTHTGVLVAVSVAVTIDGSPAPVSRIALVELDPQLHPLGSVSLLDIAAGAIPVRWLETRLGAVLLGASAGAGPHEISATPLRCTGRHRR